MRQKRVDRAEMSETYRYAPEFFDYIDRGARRSASKMVAELYPVLAPGSLVDIGCGRGIWAAEWMNAGVTDCVGVDGAYVDTDSLAIPHDRFVAQNLSRPFDLHRTFDLVQSLEVAEHLPESCADVFVDNLCRHGSLVLFSAAVPGQGGEMHINEQPLEYWRRKFSERGYTAYDYVRWRVAHHTDVEPWYRYNTLLFARELGKSTLPKAVITTRLRPDIAIPERAPLRWRIRNAVLRTLPTPLVHRLAISKHAVHNLLNTFRSKGS